MNKLIDKFKIYRIRNGGKKFAILWDKSDKADSPPHSVKQRAILDIKNRYGLINLVETGTYLGDMIFVNLFHFKKLISIELGRELWEKAVDRFKKYNNVKILHGDSGERLKDIMSELTEPTLFWLDGHYSSGITAKGESNCPVLKELACILDGSTQSSGHVILIDDAREFIGKNDYPTIDEIAAVLQAKNRAFDIEIKDDIIFLLPKQEN